MPVYTDPNKRHDFILLFDVTDGNPNGDPDAGNLPRVDPETMQGLVTDVCLKRKVRDFVALARKDDPRCNIYVESGAVLNEQHKRAYTAEGEEPTKSPTPKVQDKVRAWMCRNFYDVRMFGAVMSTGVNCGQVRGPVQLTFARSIDPITPLDVTITRVAVTKEGEDKETEMGRKAIVPYGLYRAHGFVSPRFAEDTGVTADDLSLLWEALGRMWDLDRSASRGLLVGRRLVVFSHDNPLGNAPAHKLFNRLEVRRREGVEVTRAYTDYDVRLGADDLPQGVHLHDLI